MSSGGAGVSAGRIAGGGGPVGDVRTSAEYVRSVLSMVG
jgi:hypothetical protein